MSHLVAAGASLQSLSAEQLQQLEGMERANVEARISVLRDVQKLLDSAVLRLNQYSIVMSVIRCAHDNMTKTLGIYYLVPPFPPSVLLLDLGSQATHSLRSLPKGTLPPPPCHQAPVKTRAGR